MSKFILFTNGVLSARYDSDIHGDNIPEGAIQVSDELFFQTINEQDGVWSLVDGEVVKLPFLSPTNEQIQSKINQEAREYLTQTDWYVVRFVETGVAVPQDILDARQQAREAIV